MSGDIKVLLFDVGGVLLSNGWDRSMRQKGAATFDLDWEEFEDRHELVLDGFETGRLSLDDYLTRTVFYRERSFTSEDFIDFMKDRSQPYPASLDLARRLAESGRYLLATLNNESRELNEHRIATFDLADYFSVFLSSCYLGVRKPDEEVFRLALDITQHRPEECLFIDDRAVNLECASLVGIPTIQFHDAVQLKNNLEDRGVHV
jgi:putative hydrolase of the HAD superfamily